MTQLPLLEHSHIFIRTNAGFHYRGKVVRTSDSFLTFLDSKTGEQRSLAWCFIAEICEELHR